SFRRRLSRFFRRFTRRPQVHESIQKVKPEGRAERDSNDREDPSDDSLKPCSEIGQIIQTLPSDDLTERTSCSPENCIALHLSSSSGLSLGGFYQLSPENRFDPEAPGDIN